MEESKLKEETKMREKYTVASIVRFTVCFFEENSILWVYQPKNIKKGKNAVAPKTVWTIKHSVIWCKIKVSKIVYLFFTVCQLSLQNKPTAS